MGYLDHAQDCPKRHPQTDEFRCTCQPNWKEIAKRWETCARRMVPVSICSAHRDRVPECATCFPDLFALVDEHNRLKQSAWETLEIVKELVTEELDPSSDRRRYRGEGRSS